MAGIVNPGRVIQLEGACNFRDLGGFLTSSGRTVKWRTLFRSDALHELTPADVGVLVEELGLVTVVDLRSPDEVERTGASPLARVITVHHHPVFRPEDRPPEDEESARRRAEMTLSEMYVGMLDRLGANLAAGLTAVAMAPGPVVFHCAAGKDRTGVMSAVVLGLLGVPDADIAADYAATTEFLAAIHERLRTMPGYEVTLRELPAETLHARQETMEQLLETLASRWGSVAGWAEANGVPHGAIETLRERVLE